MTGQEKVTGDCITEVTAWAGLIVFTVLNISRYIQYSDDMQLAIRGQKIVP
jgi:hypothetical protein